MFTSCSSKKLQAVYERECGAALTYNEVGATNGPMPVGYTHDVISKIVGHGVETFTQCSAFLREFGPQKSVGFRVHPNDAYAEAGATVLMTRGLGPMRFIAATRVISTVETSDRFGFTYGTLPSHPEVGEESFHLHLQDDGTVWFEVRAFSRPSGGLSWIGPIARLAQTAVTRRYFRAMRRSATFST